MSNKIEWPEMHNYFSGGIKWCT